MEHQHLAITGRSRPDPDGGDRHGVGHHGGDGVGLPFEDDGEAAGVRQRPSVVDQRPGRIHTLSLHLESTHGVQRLGREPEMAHDGDLGVEQRLDHREALLAAFELDGGGAGADQAGGVAHGIGHTDVVAQPGQVGDDHRHRLGPGDGGGVDAPCRRR